MSQLEIAVAKVSQVYHAHGHHLHLRTVGHLDDAVAHDVGTWVYAQYDFLHRFQFSLISACMNSSSFSRP